MNLHSSALYSADINIAISHTLGIEQLKNKSVLITGATGTIGSFVADMLIYQNEISNANMQIFLAGRSIEKLQGQFGNQKKLEFLKYDMESQIKFDVPVDYVIHAAGNAHPITFANNPVGTIIGNIKSTYELLEYTRQHRGIRFLYVSSGEIYGQDNASLEACEESYLGYVDLLSPRSCYPLSKRTAENLCASYWKQYGMESVIVRPCHTYGPCITSTDSRAHAQFFRSAIAGESIVLKSAGTQTRSYNYVADCASALLSVLIKGECGESYNIANPFCSLTIASLAKTIAKVGGCDVIFPTLTHQDTANQSPIFNQILSTKKIEKIGWSAAFSLEEGIEHTISILKEMQGHERLTELCN